MRGVLKKEEQLSTLTWKIIEATLLFFTLRTKVIRRRCVVAHDLPRILSQACACALSHSLLCVDARVVVQRFELVVICLSQNEHQDVGDISASSVLYWS